MVLRCALSRQIQKGQNTISVIRLCSVKKNKKIKNKVKSDRSSVNTRQAIEHLCYVHFTPAEDDVGGLEDEDEEEEDVLMGKEVFPRREEGASTLERFSGITALGGGATLPW